MARRLTVDVLAAQLIASVKGRLLYIPPNAGNASRWLLFDGKRERACWKIIGLDDVRQMAQQQIDLQRGNPANEPRDARLLESPELVGHMIAALKTSPSICVRVPNLEPSPAIPHRPGPKVGIRG